jgi:eukaryotic-like serine/threonine-protein kinase
MALRVTSAEYVGRYILLGELGQGGTAHVSLAVAQGPSGLGKLLVLKKMKPQFATEPGFSDMFLTEARLTARLNHPNIVQTNEVFEHQGLPVLVMEYLEGKSLADIGAAREPHSALDARHELTIISEALSGLHYSHELTDYHGRPLELVHRDVTPHNVFVTYDGQAKILDFGIAKLKNSSVNTETGVVKGKLRYIPPEQIVGETIDRRADVYSVGVMLWEIAAGEKLWRGMSDAAVMNRVINERIPRPSEKNPHVHPALEALIVKALSADPSCRHATALELKLELDEVRRALWGPVSRQDLVSALDATFGEERRQTQTLVQSLLTELARPRVEHLAASNNPGTLRTYAAKRPAHSRAPSGLLWLAVPPLALAATWAWRSLQDPHVPFTADGVTAHVQASASSAPILSPTQATTQRPATPSSPLGAAPVESSAGTEQPRVDTRQVVPRTQLPKRTPSADGPASGASPSISAPMPSASCEPPFEVDARGIKRFKRHCLQ